MNEATRMANVSSDVAERVARTHQLVSQVTRLTDRLERESDTALLAMSDWAWIPSSLI